MPEWTIASLRNRYRRANHPLVKAAPSRFRLVPMRFELLQAFHGDRMNLKTLAEHLGLSQTTVSRALAGYSDVAESTRHRVQDEARRLGYSPNAAAQRLALGKARAIGVVFATAGSMPSDSIFTEFLTGLAESAARAETDVLISAAMQDSNDEMRVYRRLAQTRSVDAIVLSSPLIEDPRLSLLAGLGLPSIVHGRTRAAAPYAHLDIDNDGAFYRAARMLTDLGHRRIALLNGEERFNFALDRENRLAARIDRAGHHTPSLPSVQLADDGRARLSPYAAADGGRGAANRHYLLVADHGARLLPRPARSGPARG